MLINKNLNIIHVFRITWKVDLIMLMLCTVAYFFDTLIISEVKIPGTLATLMGTAIAFFIAFNNNQAYDRWWEARIIWGGLVNDSRSWARSLLKYTNPSDSITQDQLQHIQKRMIRRHIGFLYSLKASLRDSENEAFKQFVSKEEAEAVLRYANVAEAILQLQSEDLDLLSKGKCIDGFRFVQLDTIVNEFCDGMGKSERIKNTVYPPTYIFFTRIFIWLFIVLVTMAIAEVTGIWSIILGWLIGFVFHATHMNGLSIINPFENRAVGIPLDSITRTIEINLLQALKEQNIPLPVQPIDDEYIM